MLIDIPMSYAVRPGIQIDKQDLPSVEKICKQFHVRVSSGARSGTINAIVGGAQNSDHLRGQAADFVGTPANLQKLWNWANGKFPYVEPDYSTHVHISFQHGGTRANSVPSIGLGQIATPNTAQVSNSAFQGCVITLAIKLGLIAGGVEFARLMGLL